MERHQKKTLKIIFLIYIYQFILIPKFILIPNKLY